MKQRPEYDPQDHWHEPAPSAEKKHLTVEQAREYLCLGPYKPFTKYETGVGYPQADTMLAPWNFMRRE